ncbi:unnamed protein product [Cochlearia groenlandica]
MITTKDLSLERLGEKFKEMNLGEEVKHPQDKLIKDKTTIPQGATIFLIKPFKKCRERGEEPKVHISTVTTAELNRRSGRDIREIDLWIRLVEEINCLMDEDSDGSGIKDITGAMRGMVEA